MRSILHIAIVLLSLNVLNPASAQLTMMVDTVSGNQGDQVLVPVRVNGFTDLLSMQGTIVFDSAVVSYVGVEQFGLPALSSGNFGTTNVGIGQLTFSWFDGDLSGESLADSSVVFAIRFDLIGNVGDSSIIDFDSIPTPLEFVDTGFNIISASYQAGVVSIIGVPGGSGLTLMIDSVTAYVYDTVVVPVRANNFEYIVGLQGTIGFDETIADYVSVEQFGLSGMSISNFGETQTSSGLLTFSWTSSGTGGQTVVDSTILFAVKFIAIGGGNTNTNISFLGSPTPMEVTDSNLFIINPYLLGGYLEIEPDTNNIFTLLIDSVIGVETQKVQVPVRAWGFSDIQSIQGTFQFDTAVITYSSVVNMNLQGMSSGDFGTTFVNDGMLTFSWYDGDQSGESMADSAVLFEIKFDVIGQAGDFGYVKLGSSPTTIEFINVALQTIPYGLDSGGVDVDTLTLLIDGGPITPSNYCIGDSIFVPYVSNATFDSANVFTIQLSDFIGSFSSFTTLGTVTSFTDSDTIAGWIPPSVAFGSGYRIRVVSSDPNLIGTDNGNDLTIAGYLDSVSALICQGDSIFLEGQYRTTAGTYIDSLLSIEGCDSVTVTLLSVVNIILTNDSTTICTGDSVFLGGAYQTTTGTYYDTLISSGGCDSIIATLLSVDSIFTTNLNETICSGDSIFLGGAYQTIPGIYSDSFTSQIGCDSIVYTTLGLYPTDTTNTSASICQGDSILLGGAYQTVAGNYSDIFSGTNGCDSLLITTLTIDSPSTGSDSASICIGDSIFLGGAYQTVAGSYVDSLTDVNGCDSILTTVLDVLTAFNFSDTVTICPGDSAFIAGSWESIPGQYPDSFISTSGCDSVWVTSLLISPTYTDTPTVQICSGDSIFLEGAWRTSNGTFTDSLTTTVGCDSVVTTMLVVDSLISTMVSATICNGDSILLQGTYQTMAGTYIDSFIAGAGCDSVVTTTLSIDSGDLAMDSASICQGDSIMIGGSWRTTIGSYNDTLVNMNGCDSIVTIALTVILPVTTSDTTSICQGDSIFLGGDWRSVGGTYNDTLIAISGCDSIVITTLTLIPPVTTPDTTSICTGDSIFLGGDWQLVAGTYNDTLVAVNGCDSIIATTLILDPLPTPSITPNGPTTFCIGDSVTLTSSSTTGNVWSPGGSTAQSVVVTTTSSYTVTVTDNKGCSGVSAATNVTVNALPTVIASGAASICTGDSATLTATGASTYVWDNGAGTGSPVVVFPTVTTTYTVTGTDGNTCQNTDQVTVTVNGLPTVVASGTDTICQGNSTTLTATGASTYIWDNGAGTGSAVVVSPSLTTTYTVTGTDGNSCENTDQVTITVNTLPTVTASGVDTICLGDSTTLTASGAFTYVWDNGAGSGSSVTVSPTTTTTYIVTGTDGNSCENTDQLTVTVNSLPTITAGGATSSCSGDSATLTATGASTYLWDNGAGSGSSVVVSPTSTTTYTVTGTDGNSCENTDQVTVTVNPMTLIDSVSTTNTSACGVDDGAIIIIAVGGKIAGNKQFLFMT